MFAAVVVANAPGKATHFRVFDSFISVYVAAATGAGDVDKRERRGTFGPCGQPANATAICRRQQCLHQRHRKLRPALGWIRRAVERESGS